MTEHHSVRRPLARAMAAGFILLFVFAVFAGCSREKAGGAQEPPERVVPFTITTFDNAEFSLEAVKGSPVVINFWASWCGPCKLEARALQRAYETFSPYGVKFIGVAVDDTEQGARSFVKRFALTFPIAIDSTGELLKDYNIYGIPKTYIIGRDGNIAYTHTGAISEDDLSREIRKAM